MLYEREYCNTTLTSLAIKYEITKQQVGDILTRARFNKKIVNAVGIMRKRIKEELERS